MVRLWLLFICIHVFAVALRQLIDSVVMELGASFYVSALLLALHQCSGWQANQILYWLKKQMHANAGRDTYETPQCERITKAKSECVCFPLTLMLTLCECIKGAPA